MILTARERKIRKRNAAIFRDYEMLRRENDCKPHRIMVALATTYGMTREGIRKILIEGGLYTPAKRNTNGTTD